MSDVTPRPCHLPKSRTSSSVDEPQTCLAKATVRPVAEKGLAAQLDGLALPAAGFLGGYDELVDLLRGPVGTTRLRRSP
jgi:hypothetical protein